MKIAIDARLYGLEHAGIGRYVMNLVNELAKEDKKNTYEIILTSKYYEKLKFPARWRKHKLDARHYSIKEQIQLNKLLNSLSPDLVHFPHFNVPIRYKGDFVVTIHDLSKHKSKGRKSTTLPALTYLIKRVGYKKVISHAINKSKYIITPTNYVKSDLLKYYKVPKEKIFPIYEGINFRFGEINTNVLKKYNIQTPFFIFTGSAYPHKNLDRLIEAIVYLNKQEGRKVELVISSSRNIFSDNLKKTIENKKAGKYVNMIGFASDEELFSLYKLSQGFVYPSLMEGFGLPGLEAISAGTMALVSDLAVFREVYGKCPVYFNPYDFTSIAKAMEQVLGMDRTERRNKIRENQKFVSRYSWNEMAERTLKIYESSNSVR